MTTTRDKHPFEVLRSSCRPQVTQKTLAAVAGVSPQVVMRTEQGMYNSVSPKILSALKSILLENGYEVSERWLDEEHGRFIRGVRAANSDAIRSGVEAYLSGLALQPFYKYFGVDSVAGFCKLLCLQLGPVQKWGFQGALPPLVETALLEGGVPYEHLGRLNGALRKCSD